MTRATVQMNPPNIVPQQAADRPQAFILLKEHLHGRIPRRLRASPAQPKER